METAGRRPPAEAGRPAGQFRGAPATDRKWPGPGTWGRVFLQTEPHYFSPLRQGRPQVPCSRLSLLRPELSPPRSRTLSPVHLRELFTASGGLPWRPPPSLPPRLVHILVRSSPSSSPSREGSSMVRPQGELGGERESELERASTRASTHWVRSQSI